ncbi:hypothetical protein A5780_10775 [Nocardia sp. 852002-20019_SCH5090214]|nr:hypothetical protein A5780_10775 [Nocardia sp. 852002-20019_SCH5090214]OBB52449.1 hypothetical protein A5748_15185 [Nocardia sp. 852002-51244_SCH5132740]
MFFPKSWVGSMRIASAATPAARAASAARTNVSVTSDTTSAYRTRCGRVRGRAPPVWLHTIPTPSSAATPASCGSAPAQVSLIRSAPSATAARATSLRQVSTLINRSG